MAEDLKKYRVSLTETVRALNESYDKMLLTLSGGALGLSIAFLKDVVALENLKNPEFLLWSWVAFIVSLASVLGRVMFGIEAHKKAIAQVDNGTIYKSKPGGAFSSLTKGLHIMSAAALLLGLILIVVFAYQNIGVANA